MNSSTDIVLVNPPLSGEERYGVLSAGGVYMPPLGLANLAAFIRQQGFSVKIIDCCALNLSLQDAVKTIFVLEPKCIGITAATVSIHKAAALAKLLKDQRPNTKIIIGGCHLSALPEETMKYCPQFDIGVIGEGEETIAALLRSLEDQGKHIDKVQGIIFREDGLLIMNNHRPLIDNLDNLPFPAWELLPDLRRFYRPSGFGFKRLPVTSLLTIRGCPMRCTFCSETPFAKTCRMHSVDYVMDMIKLLHRQYGMRDIMFYDGTFVINAQRVCELCERLIKEKLNLVWSCNGRINLMTRPMLNLMKRAGCWSIAYGIESGSQKVLNFIQKDIDLEKARYVLQWTKQEGILTKGYFMIGHLIDDKESLRSTRDFVLRNELDMLTLTYFSPLPGTPDYVRAEHFGVFNKEWSRLSFYNPVFIPRGLNEDKLSWYHRSIIRGFYLRPKIFLRYTVMLFNLSYCNILIASFLAFFNLMISGNHFTKRKRSAVRS